MPGDKSPETPDFSKSSTPQRNRPNPAGSAVGVSEGTPPASSAKAPKKRTEIPLVPAEGDPEKVWNDYFAKHKPEPAAVADVVLRLHKAKKTEQVIACIEAALINGHSQPWMYTVLALSMEKAGRPKEDVQRVLLSTIDYSALNVPNLLYSAAFLTRYGAKDRALALYKQASIVDPTRLEPYVLGLKLAREAGDAAGVEWAAAGILTRAWNTDYEKLHREAEETARDTEAELRKAGHDEKADKLAAAIAEARQRDLSIELTWTGKADLDLLVEEPSGVTCSFENPRTASGGVFVHDGFGPDPKTAFDKYVCPRGMAGDYRAIVRHVRGEVVGKRAVLRITRYEGSPNEMREEHVVQLGEQDKVVRLTLQRGRLKEMTALPLLNMLPEQRGGSGQSVLQMLGKMPRGSEQAGARLANSRERQFGSRLGPQTPGYQPVITVLSEGVTSSALAVVSGDRRYVRLTMVPVFSTLTDVFTFSFINSGGNPTGGGGGVPGRGTGTGGGATGP